MDQGMAQQFMQRMQGNEQGEDQRYQQPRSYEAATQEEEIPEEYYRKLGEYANPVRQLVDNGMSFTDAVKTIQQKVMESQQEEQGEPSMGGMQPQQAGVQGQQEGMQAPSYQQQAQQAVRARAEQKIPDTALRSNTFNTYGRV